MRILMMGTGTFALPTFRSLLASRHEVVGLVTQPDRTGRGHHSHPHPMKEAAVDADVPVYQPENTNAPTALERLREFYADVFIVAAYGQILSADLLSIPPQGAFNLHGSLLPKYRGAAPIQYAVLSGETETGITLFKIEPKLDAGPIVGVVTTPIGPQETSGELHDRLAPMGGPLTLQMLDELEAGTLTQTFQDPALVTKAPKIQKSQGLIDWSQTSAQIGWHVRGMQPWPMPITFLHLPERKPQRIMILEVNPVAESHSTAAPGTCWAEDSRLLVRTGDGVLEVKTLQPSGKRAMHAEEFLRGHSVTGGHFSSKDD